MAAALGTTPGGIAVDIFFITSGFLVTASLLSRSCARDFIRARVLRIYPALTATAFLTICIAGVALTELPTVRYLLHPETLLHLARNMMLVTGISHTLPGVFVGNPYPNAVNSIAEMIVWSGLLTTATAVFSWHLVEKRALALRDRLPRPSKLRVVNASAD